MKTLYIALITNQRHFIQVFTRESSSQYSRGSTCGFVFFVVVLSCYFLSISTAQHSTAQHNTDFDLAVNLLNCHLDKSCRVIMNAFSVLFFFVGESSLSNIIGCPQKWWRFSCSSRPRFLSFLSLVWEVFDSHPKSSCSLPILTAKEVQHFCWSSVQKSDGWPNNIPWQNREENTCFNIGPTINDQIFFYCLLWL
jgi:hypothetical protein